MDDPAAPPSKAESPNAESRKRAAAEAAVAEIAGGMIVGLGTGSTAAFAIAALGRRVAAGLAVTTVATSERTAAAARAAGIAVVDLGDLARIDLAIDGVDEIDADFRAIKGAGGAMLREKIVAEAADRMIAIADASKAVVRLGSGHPVPVEIAAMARGLVSGRIVRLGGAPRLRMRDGAPVASDSGNPILDCDFGPIDDPVALAAALATIPGMLGHGLFLDQIDALYLGMADGVERRERNGGEAPSCADRTHP